MGKDVRKESEVQGEERKECRITVQLSLPMIDALVGLEEEYFGLCLRSGEVVLREMMEKDRTEICGPKWARGQAREVVRAGTTRSEVTLGGRRVAITRVLRERNLAASCIIIFSTYAVLYAATTQLPSLLQTLFGYDAYLSGLVMSPAGLCSIAMMVVVGALLGRGVDARWLIASGLVVLADGSYSMSLMNLGIGPWQVIWPRVVMVVGLSLIFAPLNVAAYLYTPTRLRGAAVGLLALLRNEGGSFGTSMAQTFEERREQFHTLRLGEHLDRTSVGANAFLERAQALFLQHTGDPAGAARMARQLLFNMRQHQAASLAYFDVFWMSAMMGAGLVLAVLMMKRSVAEKGAHVETE